MLFCPTCGNLLLLEKGVGSCRYFCKTCPYIFNVNQRIKRKEIFDEFKVKDLVYGGKEEWANVPTTEAICSKCENNKAYYKEIQIRSADEPTTIFYRCTKCEFEWREG